MLNHYSLLLEIAHLQQQEMFRQAEIERLYRQIKENRPGLLQQVGHCLLATVQHFKVNLQSNPVNKYQISGG
jgi:hypothetical protein